jgi:UDP-3-O-[3-hydroxymyristoyl] glucosamine N-acyltransferase
MKLSQLAETLGATLHGDGSAEITGVAGIEQAVAGQVTFVANKKYNSLAKTTAASAVLVEQDFPEIATPTLRIADPYLAFAKTIELFYQPPVAPPGIHPTAVIAPTATIGERASIGAYVVIGDHCVVGDDAVIHPHVVLYPHVRAGNRLLAHAHSIVREHCILGDDIVLQNGAVIGGDGFGFAKTGAGPNKPGWYKIVQSGPAILEDHVEVQVNACVDRASIGETRVKRGAKIDNLVQVGHGSVVGEDTLLCAQAGLAGSSILGRNVILAGQSAVAGHCELGDGVVMMARAATSHDIAPGKTMGGAPAIEYKQWLKATALFNHLPDVIKGLRKE